MFLFPAIVSFAADMLVLFLHSEFSDILLMTASTVTSEGTGTGTNAIDGFDIGSSSGDLGMGGNGAGIWPSVLSTMNLNWNFTWSIENTSYLPSLSMIRILLLIPLNYHVYSGTRLKFPIMYTILHGSTGLFCLGHFVLFSSTVLRKEYSNGTNFTVGYNDNVNGAATTGMHGVWEADETHDLSFQDDATATKGDADSDSNITGYADIPLEFQDDELGLSREDEIIWILLLISLISICLHITIFMHVRSTAPSNDAMNKYGYGRKQSRKGSKDKYRYKYSHVENAEDGYGYSGTKKRLGYWIYKQYRNGSPFRQSFEDGGDGRNGLGSGSRRGKGKGTGLMGYNDHEDGLSLSSHEIDSDLSMRDSMRKSFKRNSHLSPLYNMRDRQDDMEDISVGEGSSESFHSALESGLSAGSNSASENETDAFLDHDVFTSVYTDSDDSHNGPTKRRNRNRTGTGVSLGSLVGIHRCFQTGYDDFMGEIRGRFTEAKIEWASRLEDVTNRIRQNESGSNSKNILSQFNQNTPFRALLHMYAHEEVFRNKRLDRAFPIGDSAELSFYAPQLLCFLLHNAFLSTGKLEHWILDRCKTDVHFAHRCFWFIRAWYLQGSIYKLEQSNELPRTMSVSALDEDHHMPLSFPNGVAGDRSHSEPDFGNIKELVKGPTVDDLKKSNGIKFPPEERRVLEELLTKVIECGEYAARTLEFGIERSSSEIERSHAVESSPLGNSFVPIDPSQEFPTMGHFNAANSKQSHGFLPHSKSSMRVSNNGEEVRSFFLRAPDFLDSLISIADDLLLESVSNRTPELRKRLKELEFCMLPSNSIYVPVNGCLHRVWRILAPESIALSTKERVPCIVYLEVIDHSESANVSENKTLIDWYKSARPPQRLNPLLFQVTRKTQKGLQKLRDDFEENQEKLFSRMNHGEARNQESTHPELQPSSLTSPVGTKHNPGDLSNPITRDSSRESVLSDDSCDAGSSPNTNLGQWATSPSRDRVEPRVKRRQSISPYGSNALTNLNEHDECYASADGLEPIAGSNPRSPLIVFKEDWAKKENRLRLCSAQGNNPNWRLLPVLIKSNDDLRQEQLASQLIRCMATILADARVPTWLYPYDIVALSFRGGVMEAIPDTISIDSLRKNHPHFTDLKHFFEEHFGQPGSDSYENSKANFVESLAAYSIVCYLLQIKDRHNGNILLDNKGHLIHIDFGFFFLSSPGKNSGFESAPFKLTSDFVEVMDGVNSHTFAKFRELCYKTFIELRKNCFQITLLVQMLMEGNEDLDCFRGRPHDAVQGLQDRLRLDLNDRACQEYVNNLINDSTGNWTTTCYDRYQKCCVGVM